MKCRMMLPMALLVVISFVTAFQLDAQTKSDLPAGWDEPTELPPGSIRLEDVGRDAVPVAPSVGGPTTPPPAASTIPSSPPPPAYQPPAISPVQSPTMAGSGAPVSGGDTRGLPVDMRFAPPEAGGMSPSMPPPPPSAAAVPISSLPPPAPIVAPARASSAGHSDLPAGWDEEAVLPADAVRLEDVNSPYEGRTDRGMMAAPLPPPPPAAAAPMPPPAYQPPAYQPPAYQPPAATTVQPAYQPPPAPEPALPSVKEAPHKAPSRWENK